MTTIRVEHKKNYTCISNDAIRDGRLSLKARGLHHLLLSYPNDWRVNTDYLASECDRDGKTALLSAMTELEEWGYLTRRKVKDEKGKFFGWERVVTELPEKVCNSDIQGASECAQNPTDGKPEYRKTRQTENLNIGKPDRRKTRKSENPKIGKPECILNNDQYEVSIEEVSISPNPSEAGEEKRKKKNSRADSTNPRARHTNPRSLGTNPRHQKTSLVEQKCSSQDKFSAATSDPFFNRQSKPNENYQGAPPLEKWEIASGEPYPYFWQWREAFYKKQGGTLGESAKSNAYSEFYNNRQRTTHALWVEFLAYYNLTLDNALALQAAGMTPTLPSCFSNAESVTEAKVATKLAALGDDCLVALPQATATPSPQAANPWFMGENAPDIATDIENQNRPIAQEREVQTSSFPVEQGSATHSTVDLRELSVGVPPVVATRAELRENSKRFSNSALRSETRCEQLSSLIERYRCWLQSGAAFLVKEAIAKVSANPDLDLIYDEQGETPIDVEVAF